MLYFCLVKEIKDNSDLPDGILSDYMQSYGLTVPDYHHTIARIDDGLTVWELQRVMELLQLSVDEMASVLHVNPRTIVRLDDPTKALKPDMAERVACLQRLIRFGRTVLGGAGPLASFIKAPSMALDGKRPFDYLGTILGMELIFDELGRIEHGVY